MKSDILKGWTNYLNKNQYNFSVDKKGEVISFQGIHNYVDGVCSYEVKVGDNNYRTYVELPVKVEESNLNQILDYIFLANANPMFAHFTYDYETNNVFCVHSSFCDSVPDDETIKISINSADAFLRAFYHGLKSVAEESLSAKEAYEKGFEQH